MGCFPIAQVREPYTTVKFLAERIDVPKLLKIHHPENDDTWSAIDICDGWALKRNFVTARTGRLDSYRAANSILRMALEGKICIYVYPPQWVDNIGNCYRLKIRVIYHFNFYFFVSCNAYNLAEKWEHHPEVEVVRWIQARNKGEDPSDTGKVYLSSEDEVDEEENVENEKQQKEEESDNSDDTSSEESEIPHVVNKFEALSAY